MPSFGPASRRRLNTCHPDIVKVLEKAIQNGPDFSVICGNRGKAAQDKAVADGMSKAPFPTSRHNPMPSEAVDIVPFPLDWSDHNRFRVLAGYILATADSLGVGLRWGGDWDHDYDESDEKGLRDLPHFELKEI
jgi:peptidoglycan LD-endopeptidase CwlK